MAIPASKTLTALSALSSDPKNIVYIISGRDSEFLEQHLGHLKGVGMSAEHGGFIREPWSGEEEQEDGKGGRWTNFTETLDMEWMEEVHEIFKYYTEVSLWGREGEVLLRWLVDVLLLLLEDYWESY